MQHPKHGLIEVPHRLALSGRGGAKRLTCLLRRAEFLKERIQKHGGEHRGGYDQEELSALCWVIKSITLYEDLLRKGPEESTEETDG